MKLIECIQWLQWIIFTLNLVMHIFWVWNLIKSINFQEKIAIFQFNKKIFKLKSCKIYQYKCFKYQCQNVFTVILFTC